MWTRAARWSAWNRSRLGGQSRGAFSAYGVQVLLIRYANHWSINRAFAARMVTPLTCAPGV